METVAGPYHYFRQRCLYKGRHRRECLSKTVCVRVEIPVSNSPTRDTPGPDCRTCTKLCWCALVTRRCSSRGALCRHVARSSARGDTTSLLPHQENRTILCKNTLSGFPLWPAIMEPSSHFTSSVHVGEG